MKKLILLMLVGISFVNCTQTEKSFLETKEARLSS